MTNVKRKDSRVCDGGEGRATAVGLTVKFEPTLHWYREDKRGNETNKRDSLVWVGGRAREKQILGHEGQF